MVYRGFGYFSITVYILAQRGGMATALPRIKSSQSQEKKDYPPNIALRYSKVLFGFHLGEI